MMLPSIQGGNDSHHSRHMGLEYLRGIAALMVVINHSWYMPFNSNNIHIFATSCVYSLVLMAVPLFVILSGAFLINNPKNTNAKYFYWHSFKKIFDNQCIYQKRDAN